jgi:hypothetical protein
MDPITILAATTAAFEGVKKAVELGREVTDVYSQLSQWAGHVGQLTDLIAEQKQAEENPSIWKKISFKESETKVAFDLYAAEEKVKEMEKEIFHMFAYGDLCHLGVDGYRRFKELRTEERERRQRMISNQIKAKKKFVHDVIVYGSIFVGTIFSVWVIWFTIGLIINRGV